MPEVHHCEPRRVGRQPHAHKVKGGTLWECPCGRLLQITKRANGGRCKGAPCGCGWEVIRGPGA